MPNPDIFPEMPSELRRFFPAIFWHWWEAFRVYIIKVASGGGGGGTPAGSVVSETSYGQAASAGGALTYSRGDHTHGTPAAQSFPAVPIAAGTVTAETSFGQASNAGAAATYSKGDHTHGTPAAPTIPDASDTVVEEITLGQASDAGASSDYSRADHTHGTPALSAITTVIYVPDSLTKVVGGTATGSVSGVQAMADGSEYSVVPVAADPGVTVDLDFVNVVAIPTHIVLRTCYESSSNENIEVQLYNHNTTNYDNITEIFPTPDYIVINAAVPEFTDYVDAGAVTVRISQIGTGNIGSKVWLEYAALYSVGRGVAIFEGLDADKPAASNSGTLYYATDTNKMYYDPVT